MRILQLIHSRNFAGSEQYVLTLSSALQRSGHTVWVATRAGKTLAKRYAAAGLKLCPVALGSLGCKGRLRRFVEAEQIEVIHTHLTQATRLGCWLEERTAAALVAHAHINREDRAYARAAALKGLIAVSEATAGYYASWLPQAHLPIRVIPNGSAAGEAPEAARPKAEVKAALAAELGFAPEAPLIVLLGRLTEAKGQEVLLKAVPAVLKKYPSARFVFAGGQARKAAYRRRIDALLAPLQRSGNVLNLGFRDDAFRLTRAADVQVVPSQSQDPFPYVVMEAMHLGTPLVASAVGGIPEMTAGGCAVLVPPGDPQALAEHLIALLDDPGRRSQLAASAQARAQEHYSTQALLERILPVYEACVAAKRGR